MREPALSEIERRFLADARRAVLVTVDADGRPRPVPICHVVIGQALYTPIDEKPKSSSEPAALARVRDIAARPDVAVLVDRWSEDWSELGWLRVRGRASLVEPGAADHGRAVAALREKYPQYAEHRLEDRPMIVIEVAAARSWGRVG